MQKNKITSFMLAIIICLCGLSMPGCDSTTDSTPTASPDTEPQPFAYVEKLFNNTYVHEIKITLSSEDYHSLLTRAIEKNNYIGDVEVDGVIFNDVKLSPKGGSTLTELVKDQKTNNVSLRLKFKHDGNGSSCYGLDTLHLNNNYTDPSKLRDHLAYQMFDVLGVPAPLTSYAHVTVNGEEFGLYLAVEGMEKSFLARNGLDDTELYKPESDFRDEYFKETAKLIQGAIDNGTLDELLSDENIADAYKYVVIFAVNYRKRHGLSETDSIYKGSDFKYTGDDPENYTDIFKKSIKNCSDKDKKKVIKALKNLSEMNVDESLNTSEIIAYFAVNNLTFNIDGINYLNNYYLAEKEGLLMIFPWDYNSAMPEAYLSEEKGYIDYNVSIDEVMNALNFAENPIWSWIPSNEKWLDSYHEALNKLLAEYLENNKWQEEINRVNEMIRPYIEKETSGPCTLEEYDNAVSQLKNFFAKRTADIRNDL